MSEQTAIDREMWARLESIERCGWDVTTPHQTPSRMLSIDARDFRALMAAARERDTLAALAVTVESMQLERALAVAAVEKERNEAREQLDLTRWALTAAEQARDAALKTLEEYKAVAVSLNREVDSERTRRVAAQETLMRLHDEHARLRELLTRAESYLRAVISEDDGNGAFVRGVGVELAGFGAIMKRIREALAGSPEGEKE